LGFFHAHILTQFHLFFKSPIQKELDTIPLLPFVLLLVLGLAMAVVYARWRDVRPAWGVGLVGWIVLAGTWLFLRSRLPISQIVGFWSMGGATHVALALRLDEVAWKATFALTVLALAAWLQAALKAPDARWWRWFFWLGLLGAAWAASLAADGLTLLLAWTAFDGLDFALALVDHPADAPRGALMRALALRAVSLYLLLWGSLRVGGVGNPLAFAAMPAVLAQLLWLAIGLRWIFALFPSTQHGRGTSVLRQGGLLISGVVVLARMTRMPLAPWGLMLGWIPAMLAALALWWSPRSERWSKGWTLALGGVLWGLTPWQSAEVVMIAAILGVLGGAIIAWGEVKDTVVFGLGVLALVAVTAYPWLIWPLWSTRPGVAVAGVLLLSWVAVASWRRLRMDYDPMPDTRVDRVLWYGSLGLAVAAMAALSVGRVWALAIPASLPVLGLAGVWAFLSERSFAQDGLARLQRWTARLQQVSLDVQLWRWISTAWQRLVQSGMAVLEGQGGMLWALLLTLILLNAWGGGR